MDDDPACIAPDTVVRDALERMLRERLRHLIVVDEDDEVLGLIGDRDLRAWLPNPQLAPEAFAKAGHGTTVRSVMTRNPVTIDEETPLAEAVQRFRQRRVEVMPVLRSGRLVGTLNQYGLLSLLLGLLGQPAVSTEEDATGRTESSASSEGTRVLVIEDDHVTRRILCHHLERASIHVTLCEDGGSAAALLERESFDLILTDINLPKISGLGLLDTFNGRLSATKKVVMSASHRDEMILEAFRLGADDFIKKPFNPEILMCRVRRLLSRV